MAVVHAGTQTAVAALAARAPSSGGVLRPVALGVLVAVALVWAAADRWLGRPRAGMTWFCAALVAGPVAGALAVLAQSLLVDRTGLEALAGAITAGAAFTALLVMVPAALGLGLGRLFLTNRSDPDSDPVDPSDPGSGAGSRASSSVGRSGSRGGHRAGSGQRRRAARSGPRV